MSLRYFVSESNRIEGIQREPYDTEIGELARMLEAPSLTVVRLCGFVNVYQPNAKLRTRPVPPYPFGESGHSAYRNCIAHRETIYTKCHYFVQGAL